MKYIGGRKNMLKRASRKLRSTPAKTLMYIILFLVLFLAIFSMLMIGIASGNKVKRAQETLANSITLRGPAEGEAGKSCTVYAIPSAIVEKFIDSNYVQGYTMEAGTYWLDPVDTETYISEETQQRLKGYLKDSGMYTMTAVIADAKNKGCWNTGLRIRYLFSGKGLQDCGRKRTELRRTGQIRSCGRRKIRRKKSSPCGRYC